jgi:hypothetical protein
MKTFFKWFFGLLLALLLAVVTTGGAIYLGWIPVPGWVVSSVAASRGLTEADSQRLARTLNVYQVIRTAPEGKILDKALALSADDPRDSDWVQFAKDHWPQVSADTKAKVRDQLGVEPADFAALDELITNKVAKATDATGFRLTPDDEALLKRLDAKYGFTDLLAKLKTP